MKQSSSSTIVNATSTTINNNTTNHHHNNNTILIDSISGFISGIAALCVSQPFDTIRVRAQTIDNPAKIISHQIRSSSTNNNNNNNKSMTTTNFNINTTRRNITTSGGHLYNTINGTFQGYGLLGFYRGIVPPLVATSIISTTVFSSFEMVKRQIYNNIVINKNNHNKNNKTLSSSSLLSCSLPVSYIFIAGSCSGFLTSFLTTPLHRVKVQLQTTTSYQYQQHTLRSTITCAKNILQQEGLRNGMYKGWNAQVLSETIGRGVYFGTYEMIKRFHMNYYYYYINEEGNNNNNNNNNNRSMMRVDTATTYNNNNNIPLHIRMLSGAISGIVGWTIVYPIDVLKNRIQAEKIGDGKNTQSLRNLYRLGSTLYHNHGITIFYRGLSVMLVRAFPVSAIALPTYDIVHEYLEGL